MWEQVGVTAAAVRGPHRGTPGSRSPVPCPRAAAGLRQRLGSRGQPTMGLRQELRAAQAYSHLALACARSLGR